MPLKNSNLLNDHDPETQLENANCEKDIRVVSDGQQLADGIIEMADKDEYVDEP